MTSAARAGWSASGGYRHSSGVLLIALPIEEAWNIHSALAFFRIGGGFVSAAGQARHPLKQCAASSRLGYRLRLSDRRERRCLCAFFAQYQFIVPAIGEDRGGLGRAEWCSRH